MAKAVLISIRPEWVVRITSGKKRLKYGRTGRSWERLLRFTFIVLPET